MAVEHQEHIKLELAAEQLVKVVGMSVGEMLFAHEIVIYGNTEDKREEIYKTLEGYGYRWDENRWILITPTWINKLVAEAWIQHEITR